MKRLLKAFVILGMLIAGILLVIRWLERKGEDDGLEPAWPPPPPPEHEPSGIAEEMVSVVDEPIAVEPEPASDAGGAAAEAQAEAEVERGEMLTEELLGSGAPSPAETFDADAVPAVVEPDEVLAEERDDGLPVPEAELAETPATEDAADQVDRGAELGAELLGEAEPAPEEMPSPTETQAAVEPDEVLAEARDEGLPVSEAELAETPATEDAAAQVERGTELEAELLGEAAPAPEEMPSPTETELPIQPGEVLAEARDEGLLVPEAEVAEPASGEAPAEHAPDDFLTRAFEDLAATPEGAGQSVPSGAPETIPAEEPAPRSAAESDAAPAAESPAEPEAAAARDTPEPEQEEPHGGWGPAEAAVQPLSAGAESGPDLALADTLEQAMSDLGPGAITPRPARNAESFLDEGNVYFNVGQYSLAIDRYTKAVELDETLTAAYYNRANARTRAGEFDLALEDYDRALRLAPNDADALNNRGMLHLYRQNYAAALRDFNAALAEDPNDTTVMVNRGLAHLHGGDPARAAEDFREATTLDPGDAAAHYGSAQASATLGRREDALAAVERALTIDQGYAREAAADPRLAILQGDEEFMRILRQAGR